MSVIFVSSFLAQARSYEFAGIKWLYFRYSAPWRHKATVTFEVTSADNKAHIPGCAGR